MFRLVAGSLSGAGGAVGVTCVLSGIRGFSGVVRSVGVSTTGAFASGIESLVDGSMSGG